MHAQSFHTTTTTITRTTTPLTTSTPPSITAQSSQLSLPPLSPHHRLRGLISRGAGGNVEAEGSLQDLRKAVEGSVFGRKRRKASLKGEEEEEWIFGRPEGIDEDTGDQFHKAFEEMVALGVKVHEKSVLAEGDKGVFGGSRKVGTPLSRGSQSRLGSSKSKTSTNPHTSVENLAAPKRRSKRENPSQTHHASILVTGRAGRAALSATLKSRRQDRLEACKTVEGHRQVGKMVDMDVNVCAKFGVAGRRTRPVWEGIVPYLWYKDAATLVREHYRQKTKTQQQPDPQVQAR
ncbi:hypothetical protein HK097_006547, partial [Rhizophlyctis rosea]